jgi:PIN domain nuclease of toxin-antitoxin system
MRVLLDTHALLWYHFGDASLSATARTVIEDPANRVLVSAISVVEVAIKVSIGKLSVNVPFDEFVKRAVYDQNFTLLPVTPEHAAAMIPLPFHHRDPFDRLLVAQAVAERVPLVSCDADVLKYPVTCLW